ncbi:MAG: adenylate/guanylate cyclase domain-containing protein, partial [Desulfovibrionales bacterium]|nr:adenylate/guanylate cyclase domain-containing protein [Desulfovibrionales bacterium]
IDTIHAHHGIIVDFFGDAVLAFFDTATESIQKNALKCVQCASTMQEQMIPFNAKMARENLPGMDMGIGIHSGQVVVGNIGSKIRLKYGVVGASVNMVSRIQGCARGGEIVVSDETYQYIHPYLRVDGELSVELKGISSPVRLRSVRLI